MNTYKGGVSPQGVKKIGLVGSGTIGSAWAAHFLARGLDVVATDPDPTSEKRLRAAIDNAWPSLKKLGLAAEASKERLRFTTSIENAVHDADFIQESVPEQESIKNKVLEAVSNTAPPSIVIASSTSNIMPTRLQEFCKSPERLIVGHPFNPVYLMPLVEVVAGEHTSKETIAWTMAFYSHWGKRPLHCKAEITGHIANRLQDAVMLELMQLIKGGYATTADLDAAMTGGPGLRWALLGPFMTWHMAAGDGGLRTVFDGKFGTSNSSEKNIEYSHATLDGIFRTADSQISGRSLEEMEVMRDEFLVGVLTLSQHIETKYGFSEGRFISDKTV